MDCESCRYYTFNPHLSCTVHPYLLKDCPDYAMDDLPVESWEPDGASYYDGELIMSPVQRLTLQQRLELLDTHPLFTGRCPNCESPIPSTLIHLDCDHCGWKDDSI